MAPAKSQRDAGIAASLHHLAKAAVAINLQHATEVFQMQSGALTLAVHGIDEGSGRRGGPAPGPVIHRVAPQPPGLGFAPAGIEHRQGGVVGEDFFLRGDMGQHPLIERPQPPAGPTHPVAEGRAIEQDTLALEDLRLAIQRQVIRELADQYVRNQGFGRHAAIDRARRGRGLDDRTRAGRTRIAPPADHLHPELRGYDVEHLARGLADLMQHTAAAGAILVLKIEGHFIARQ